DLRRGRRRAPSRRRAEIEGQACGRRYHRPAPRARTREYAHPRGSREAFTGTMGAAMALTRPSSLMRERTYPPPYPDGWYRVALSSELKPGQIRYLECLGQQMV